VFCKRGKKTEQATQGCRCRAKNIVLCLLSLSGTKKLLYLRCKAWRCFGMGTVCSSRFEDELFAARNKLDKCAGAQTLARSLRPPNGIHCPLEAPKFQNGDHTWSLGSDHNSKGTQSKKKKDLR
jgi:hypothetical protein